MIISKHYQAEFDIFMNIHTLIIENISYSNPPFEYIPKGLNTLQLEFKQDESWWNSFQVFPDSEVTDQI